MGKESCCGGDDTFCDTLMCEQRDRAAGRGSATASSDPLALAGLEFVDLQQLIQMLTKHLGCVRGRCLESFVLRVFTLPVYLVCFLRVYSTSSSNLNRGSSVLL